MASFGSFSKSFLKAHKVSTSAYEKYIDKLTLTNPNAFNPTVVQTNPEFVEMLKDMSTRVPLVVRTVKLPEDMTMTDLAKLRLRHPITSTEVTKLSINQFPDLELSGAVIADVDSKLVPDHWLPSCANDNELRFQVIEPRLENLSNINCQIMQDNGYRDVLSSSIPECSYDSNDIEDYCEAHRPVSSYVKSRQNKMRESFLTSY